MANTSRECALEGTLLRLYETWARLPISPGYHRHYYAEYFRQTIVPGCKRYKGGVQAVEDMLLKKKTSGLERLRPYPHLTVEHLVASGEWNDLFGERLQILAQNKLRNISR
jgi:hypothetical protein